MRVCHFETPDNWRLVVAVCVPRPPTELHFQEFTGRRAVSGKSEKGKIMSIQRMSVRVFIATIVAAFSLAVLAASPHYKRGPTCVDNGLTVTCTGTVAGL